jgi:predicted aspartyl protease
MTEPFESQRGLIIVITRIWGPAGDAFAQLALDTGATTTVIDTAMLERIGYGEHFEDRVHITTGSGIEFVPRVTVSQLKALGKTIRRFPVLAHILPPTVAVDGLLGLDFLRRRRLTLDFRRSTITLT